MGTTAVCIIFLKRPTEGSISSVIIYKNVLQLIHVTTVHLFSVNKMHVFN